VAARGGGGLIEAPHVLADGDDHSRNGIAIAARGAMQLRHGSRIMVGDKLLRVELPGGGPEGEAAA
jgi:hypothetical protein